MRPQIKELVHPSPRAIPAPEPFRPFAQLKPARVKTVTELSVGEVYSLVDADLVSWMPPPLIRVN